MFKKNTWSSQEIIFLTIIAIFFGILYETWNFVYYFILSTPLSLFANDMTFGVWIMAGPLSSMLIKKKYASIFGEFLSALVEMFLFSSWGMSTLFYGIIQGIGSEAGFFITKYKSWNLYSLLLSGFTCCCITFFYDFFISGYNKYSIYILLTLFIIRLLSIELFSGFLVYYIINIIKKAGVI